MINDVADTYTLTGHPRYRTPEVLPPSPPQPPTSPPRECPLTEYATVTPPLPTSTDIPTQLSPSSPRPVSPVRPSYAAVASRYCPTSPSPPSKPRRSEPSIIASAPKLEPPVYGSSKDNTSSRKRKRGRAKFEISECIPTILTSPSQSLEQPQRAQELCTRCESIDLDDLCKWIFKRKYMREVRKLGQIDDASKISRCTLCRLFALMRPASLEVQEYTLMAFGSRVLDFHDEEFGRDQPSPAKLGVEESVLLGLIPTRIREGDFDALRALRSTGYICSLAQRSEQSAGRKPSFQGSLLHSEKIDFVMLRSWLRICQEHHTRFCGLRFDSAALTVPFLQVIDCDTRRIVPATNDCPYLALSYVWGSSVIAHRKNEVKFLLPDDLPNVIQDAVAVTRELGFRYLWVDYYCIDQDNEREKVTQIKFMGLIYEMAEATIVAAAGEDASFGLPGVGNTPRLLQPRAIIGKQLLVSLLPDPRLIIKQSRWMIRGWTYQEALLSRRLLIFIQHQVYFECRSMHCKESVQKPLRELHNKDMQRFKKFCHPGMFLPINQERRKLVPWQDFPKVLSGYTKRTLSYSSDSLNAILGILQMFEQTATPTYHHFGVPILPPFISNWTGPTKYRAIKRSSAHGFAIGLRWDLVKPSKRCSEFPSWSWTGWNGVVDSSLNAQNRYNTESNLNSPYSDIRFRAETKNGQTIDWDDLKQIIQTKSQDLSSLSPILIVDAYTIKLRFDYNIKSADAYYGSGYYWKWPRKPTEFPEKWGPYFYLHLSLTIEPTDDFAKRLVEDEWEAIALSVSRDEFMIIDEKNGVAERIGILTALNAISTPEDHALLKLSRRTIRLG